MPLRKTTAALDGLGVMNAAAPGRAAIIFSFAMGAAAWVIHLPLSRPCQPLKLTHFYSRFHFARRACLERGKEKIGCAAILLPFAGFFIYSLPASLVEK
ncbi:MAG: hypothetical protein ACR2KT_12580 [Methylocella sp.]|nr:MAG: hypothetical protein DLM68_11965 [Hyphomicrobiales bacterium]